MTGQDARGPLIFTSAARLLCIVALTVFAAIIPVRPALAADTLPVTEIAEGVFVFTGVHELFTPENAGGISNAGFIVGSEAVAVIDTGGSRQFGQALLETVRQQTDLPVRYVINTHMHPDHIFGNTAFAAPGVVFAGHHKLERALKARSQQYLQANAPLLGAAFAGTQIVLPTHAVTDSDEIDLGGRVLLLQAHGTSHTDNDLTVFDRKTRTLFAGDLLFHGHVPVVDGSITGWLKTMTALSQLNADRVVPGHGPASMPWPDALNDQQRYLEALVREIRALIDQGKTLAEAARTVGLSERDKWLLFDEFNARSVSAAFAELEWE